MTNIDFIDNKERIKAAINRKIKQGIIKDPKGFILIDGFHNLMLRDEVGGNFSVGGPVIPAVSVVGKSTGLIHTFALKALLPDLDY